MSTKRGVQTDESFEQTGEMAAYETTRSAADSSSDKAPPKKDEEHISVFWRVFGGTILSIVALVAVTLYNNTSSSIIELRGEVSREREARAELVKKDEFNTRTTAQYERMRAIDTIKVELEGVKEKVNTNTATVDGSKRDTIAALEAMRKEVAAHADAMKKDAAALEVLKERVVLVEGVKKDVAAMESLKEKLTTALAGPENRTRQPAKAQHRCGAEQTVRPGAEGAARFATQAGGRGAQRASEGSPGLPREVGPAGRGTAQAGTEGAAAEQRREPRETGRAQRGEARERHEAARR